MPAYLQPIETLVPRFVHRQSDIEDSFLEKIEDRRLRLLLRRSLRGSGIETRHSVCESFFDNELFDEAGRASTGNRNRVFARESRILAAELGRKLFARPWAPSPQEITHLIFATCTGFTNPGPDYHLIHDLGLRPGVQRYILGFMGCYAGVPALRLAGQICAGDPNAQVLVVCLELCSLHLRFDTSYDSILASSLFADGAAATVVSGQPLRETNGSHLVSLGDFHTAIIPEGESDMSWTIGDQGFDLVLSNRVPELLEHKAGEIIRSWVSPDEIDHWAVHPGGRGILDKIEKAVPLQPDQLIVSRQVMKGHGNMAGVTVLFVLKEILSATNPGDQTLAIAFGPGMTVEAGLFKTL